MWWDSVSGQTEVWHFFNVNLFLLLFSICGLLKCLRIFAKPEVPKVVWNRKSEKNRISRLIDSLSILKIPYVPPKMWGFSGHMQTAIYGALKHPSIQRIRDKRIPLRLSDNSTITFDIFEPTCSHLSGHEVTLVLVPGISNCAESNYIRTLVNHSSKFGFRCAALNHIGVLPSVEVTGQRIFNYGIIEEVTAMMDYLYENYPKSLFINIGFSMGANLTSLYLIRTAKEIRSRVLLGMSICQGYSATVSMPMYHDWNQGRRFYNHMIVENVKRILRRNYDQVVGPLVEGGKIDEKKLWAATSIASLDEEYNRRIAGYSDLDEFYEWCSCLPLLESLALPMVFVNSEDDPVIPKQLYEPVQKICSERDDLALVTTKFGGHLGFLEGSSFPPSSTTWLDRFIVEVANEALSIYG